MTIIEDRLAALADITLDSGAHGSFEQGHCAMEVVAWLAGQGHTDAPECASPILRRYTIALNDRWNDEKRQSLIPFLPRMVGTGNDGKDPVRERIALDFLATNLLGPWLRMAGLDAQADTLEACKAGDRQGIRDACRAASDAAWELRKKNRKILADKIKAELVKQGKPAAASADAAASAVADAAASAVASADAVAAAAAAASADAAAAAVADAAASAAADAAAAAVAVAAASAAADAAAAAVAAKSAGESTWSVAYRAARKYYDEHPLPISQQVAELAASQEGLALELLDLMIDAEVSA